MILTSRESSRRWNKEHAEKMRAACRRWRENHPGAQALADKKHKEAHPEAVKASERKWRTQNPAKKYATNLRQGRFAFNHRARISKLLKEGRTEQDVLTGCSWKFLREHIESLWQPGMSWENYGRYGWHVDHIVPMSAFDLADPDQRRACFNYSNLQPLWAQENLRKGSKIEGRVTSSSRT